MNDNQKNTYINEQDIFNYIFYPESLSAEKRLEISENGSFGEMLLFYKQLKTDLGKPLDQSIKIKLASKISAYTLSNIVIMHPLKLPNPVKPKTNRLAAASTELKPQTTTKTFVDNEKDYMIKVLNYGETTKVYVFSTKDEVIKDFNIIIEPQHLEYHLDDNSEPLVLDKLIDADSIRLQFGK